MKIALIALALVLSGCVTGRSTVIVQTGCGASLEVKTAGLPFGGEAHVDCPGVK